MIVSTGIALGPDTEWRGSGVSLRFQGDGNVVLYGRNGHVVWSADIAHPRPHAFEFDASANLVAYGLTETGLREAYWASRTYAPGGFLELTPRGLRVFEEREITLWEPPAHPDEQPPPPVPTLLPMRVEQNRRYFRTDAGRQEWREVSGFSLLARVLQGQAESHVRPWLRYWRGRGQTVVRNILTLDGHYWRHFRSAPDMPGFYEGLDLLARMHAEEGLYMRAVYLGALEPFGGDWDPATRRDVYSPAVRDRAEGYVLDAARVLAPYPHIIGELANEREQIGMRDSWRALVDLGERVKAIAPGHLLCASEGVRGEFLIEPFDYADAHFERQLRIGGFEWVKRVSEYLVWLQEAHRFPADFREAALRGALVKRMAFVLGEPPNYGEDRQDGRRGDVEKNPAACFGAAAMSRARQGAGMCLHYDGGLWTTLPTPETERHVTAFHAALDAFPMLEGRMWRWHHGSVAGDYWREVPASTDEPSVVEAHLRAGRGPYRIYGLDDYSVSLPEPHAWDWRRFAEAPVDRVAYCDDGEFPSAVYRRTA